MTQRYQTIAKALLREISGGRYAPGSALPRRTELASQFGVTRSTIDRSIRSLCARGVLESHQGSGTYVADAPAPLTLGWIGRTPGDTPEHGRGVWQIHRIALDSLKERVQRSKLGRFDGLIWALPPQESIPWIRETQGVVPQIVMNRHLDEFNYVSTAHCDAIHDITSERLAAVPGVTPFFLRRPRNRRDIVSSLREQGFVAACRERKCFYETLEMPDDFEAALALLETRVGGSAVDGPVLLVSEAIHYTGAVVAWARERRLQWQRDIFYSDFDNAFERHVWGVKITSFVQDYERLTELALSGLAELVEGKRDAVQISVPPRFVRGDT